MNFKCDFFLFKTLKHCNSFDKNMQVEQVYRFYLRYTYLTVLSMKRLQFLGIGYFWSLLIKTLFLPLFYFIESSNIRFSIRSMIQNSSFNMIHKFWFANFQLPFVLLSLLRVKVTTVGGGKSPPCPPLRTPMDP